MKKTLGVVAAAAMAALPMMGAMAVDPTTAADPAALTDTLTVNVNGICTFERTTGNGLYTKTMVAGALDSSFGAPTFTAKCNNSKGYKITAAFDGLTHQGGDGETIAYSQTTPQEKSGTWTAKLSGQTDNLAASDAVVANTTEEDPAAGSAYAINYTVSLHDDQAQGTYVGTAVYTLTQNTN